MTRKSQQHVSSNGQLRVFAGVFRLPIPIFMSRERTVGHLFGRMATVKSLPTAAPSWTGGRRNINTQ